MGYYYPYFRGKQYELITIRDNAQLLERSEFVPIIEPVKESTAGLERALSAVLRVGGECILVGNPNCGDHCQDWRPIGRLLDNRRFDRANALSVGLLLTSSMSVNDAVQLCQRHDSHRVTLIHYGFEDARSLADELVNQGNVTRHVFVENYCGKLYRRNFEGKPRILLADGFQRRINREHPPSEPFSDLYLTFSEENMDGFGDFLIVGDEYFESGGPAYAVVIHLTYIDPAKDGAMHIYHFKSDRTETQTDPAGKFYEALTKLVAEVNRPDSLLLRTGAIGEFLALHNRRHFPGLGYVKKLSMQHHLEILADHFARYGR